MFRHFTFLLLIALTVVSSCKKDDDNTAPYQAPKISFAKLDNSTRTFEGYTTSQSAVQPYDSLWHDSVVHTFHVFADTLVKFDDTTKGYNYYKISHNEEKYANWILFEARDAYFNYKLWYNPNTDKVDLEYHSYPSNPVNWSAAQYYWEK